MNIKPEFNATLNTNFSDYMWIPGTRYIENLSTLFHSVNYSTMQVEQSSFLLYRAAEEERWADITLCQWIGSITSPDDLTLSCDAI